MNHQPEYETMLDAFERLFSATTADGTIEIAWTAPDSGHPNQAKQFPVEDYAEAAAFAQNINAKEGQNVYFGPAIRKPGTIGRAKDEDVIELPAIFADFDDDGSIQHAMDKAKAENLAPPVVVTTGRHPHVRGHFYYPVEAPIKDQGLMRQGLTTLAKALGGDPACKNPSRIMRVPGSVAWAKKEGRETEMTGLKMKAGRRQRFYPTEFNHLVKEEEPERYEQPATSTLQLRNHMDWEKAKQEMINGNQWHNHMIAIVASMTATGQTRDQIHEYLNDTTLPGYTDQDTYSEIDIAINGAIAKGYAPEQSNAQKAQELAVIEQQETWDDTEETFDVTWFDEVEQSTDTMDFVEDTLGTGAMSVVYGESNSGKTFFACDLALHASLGWQWRGRETDQTGVLYVALEGTHGIRNRIAAFREHYYKDMAGEIPHFGVITTTIDLLNPEADTHKLISTIKKSKNIGLIVIDTLSRAIAGGNENSSDDMGALVINSDRIRTATDAHIMWIHHSGKDQARGARGHSLLRAATDTEIEIKAQDGISIASVKKQRDLEGGQEYPFSLKQVTLGCNRRGKEVTSCVVTHDITMPEPKKVGRNANKRNKAGELAKPILQEAIGQIGHRVQRNGIPDNRDVIPMEAFKNAYKAAGIVPAEQNSAYFKRGWENLLNTGDIAMNNNYVWFVDAEEGNEIND